MQGLCGKSEVDEQFVLLPEQSYNGNIIFFGFGGTNIIFDKETKSWMIIKDNAKKLSENGHNLDSTSIIGIFQPELSHLRGHLLPVGRNFWNLTDDCNQILPLKLTNVCTLMKKLQPLVKHDFSVLRRQLDFNHEPQDCLLIKI